MTKTVGIVVLAAGKGTRMKMDVSKPMVPLLGKCLIDYPLYEGYQFMKEHKLDGEITIVTGYKREELESYLNASYGSEGKNISYAFQKEQLGTAHALQTYFEQNPKAASYDYIMVLCADTPLIKSEDLSTLYSSLIANNLDGVAATFEVENPYGYGRIVRRNKGFAIVEQKDASEDIRKIKEVNSGLYILNTKFTLEHLNKIDSNNKAGEFYLTDLFQENFAVQAIKFEDGEAFFGVNDLFQLEKMRTEIRMRNTQKLSEQGVLFIDASNVYLDEEVEIGEGTIIHPNVHIFKGTKIGSGVVIEPGCFIKSSVIEDNATIKANSYLDDATVRSGASIGPMAHLRPGADIGCEAKIGNFVEIKKSKLAKGVKVSHLSYVGDAEVGEETNIGCGFITCNYDGANKHLTKIGKGCFIGSDSQMVAPVEIGNECYVASGSTINQSMQDGDFAIARSRQVTKPGMARKFIKKKS